MSNNIYFSKKKYISDYLNFDWERYLTKYNDLNYMKTKKEVWLHWLNYGRYEGRNIDEFVNKNVESVNKNVESVNKNDESVNKNDEFVNKNVESVNFEWETYVNNYDDLKHIETKEEAWQHWIIHGKNENRIIHNIRFKQNKNDEYKQFDWETYVNNYDDLKHIETKDEAWQHWIIHGKNENRIIHNIRLKEENTEFTNFDWKNYIQNYDDLKHIETKKEAWQHWINHGISEGRTCEDLFKICLDEFNQIIKEEDSFEKCDYSLNKIYVKQKYTHCGKHFFGWKSAMNYLLNNLKWNDLNLDKKYYLDEWIEKLLVWGNKIQNTEKIKDIEKENLQLITFLHCPPFDSYSKELTKDLLLSDDLLLNKNIFEIIDKNNLFDSITFLYVLSLDHKKYIINTYPKFKNKVVSLYHPIDIDNCKQSELFDISNFFLNKNIYHIGWWLRNFTTFFNFNVPFDFKKKILVKQEFQSHFDSKFLNCALDKSIDVVYELNDEEYVKIFNNSCIFCDLVDCVANNIVLECIKYNTPIIIKRLPSIEEYLGEEYPLFFNEEKDLEIFRHEETLKTKIIAASLYLKKMNKTHLTLENFSKKINYDINKLQINDNYKLTWLYHLKDEKDDVKKYISDFKSQKSREIKLVIINSLKSKKKILKKYACNNITVINNEENLNMEEIYNLFIKNSTTEYLTIKNYNVLNNKNYSDLCINYLEQNPAFDIIFFKNTFHDINDDFSDLSDDFSVLTDDFSDLTDDFSDLSHDLNNKNKILKKEVNSLNFTEIKNYELNNTNILWRKSVHSYVNYLDNNFFVDCYKNHMNIVEIA